ncbi:MAG TPA: hypothetical protein VLK65_04695 [Vicinamibacteria bacterium]|nr:hypothetical protein [Vicinamibacteria bacterium]
MHRTSITFPEKLFRRAKLRAAAEGTTLSEVLRKLLDRWTRGELSIAPEEPEDVQRRKAMASFGIWGDLDPDVVLESSRRGLWKRDEELADARVDSR